MGNCLVMEKKVIKIVRNDGKVLEYREPVDVHRILSQFSGHSLFDNSYHLMPNDKLLSGHLYYLLPTNMIKKKTIKKVTFADPEVKDDRPLSKDNDTCESNNDMDGDEKSNVGVVRMKIVVHKQELEKLLHGGSVHEMVYESLEKECYISDHDNDSDDDIQYSRGWRPMLDSIPESDE